MARKLEHPSLAEMNLDAVMSALSDPIRRQILSQLSCGHDDQSCIAFELPVSKSTSTHHFRVLREAGLITQRYEGTSILSALRSEDMEERFPGLLSSVMQAALAERNGASVSS
ncbi:transcriptional regulator [Corynebacterium suranareeae]|uniref:Transcriptional regulator n=1 Tax=Corynebacterium suranareeae TaxID=2506452 RepID=A0A169SBW2_9CORY|nr:metalloregulator ArsR/SmtB family transcription factor [Corynebacterium suranareeae]BAU97395.1 transcriptional regulator [Corynebacterium suranareeae]